jgi:thiol-disulfide isomerase/thioredoxin
MLDSSSANFSGNSARPPKWPLIALLFLVVIVAGALFYRGNLIREDERSEASIDLQLKEVGSKEILGLVKEAGKVSLVNIWATWCQPCIEEFPYLVELKKKYPDLNLVLVSADVEEDRQRVLEFLAEQGVDFITYIKAEPDNEFVSALSREWTGALPATFVYNAQGVLKDFWMGDASLEEFSNAVERAQQK